MRCEAGNLKAKSQFHQTDPAEAGIVRVSFCSIWKEELSKKEFLVNSFCIFSTETITVGTVSQWITTSLHPPLELLLMYRNLKVCSPKILLREKKTQKNLNWHKYDTINNLFSFPFNLKVEILVFSMFQMSKTRHYIYTLIQHVFLTTSHILGSALIGKINMVEYVIKIQTFYP